MKKMGLGSKQINMILNPQDGRSSIFSANKKKESYFAILRKICHIDDELRAETPDIKTSVLTGNLPLKLNQRRSSLDDDKTGTKLKEILQKEKMINKDIF